MKLGIFVTLGVLLLLALRWFIRAMRHRARMQHYIFAHQLLPSQMFAQPESVLLPMISEKGFCPEGREHLLQFWQAAGENLSERDLVSHEGLTYSVEVLGHPNSTAYLVELPQPKMKPEAYFALMVFDAPGLCCGTIRQLRYFVLEHWGEENGLPKTHLGEWVPKDNGSLKYVSHGSDIPPEKDMLMAKVEQIIQSSGSQP